MLLDSKEPKKVEEEGAPAVVGQLSVSNDLLDFSKLASKKSKKSKCSECKLSEDEKNLTPRERAILARKKNK